MITATETKKHYWLYILKLEHDKYYIGITTKDVEVRMAEHARGFLGAKWTRTHKPLSILDKKDLGFVTHTDAEHYEQEVTLRYMEKYGLQNVRGGRLTYAGKYYKLGDRYFTDENFYILRAVAIMVILMLAATVFYYLKPRT